MNPRCKTKFTLCLWYLSCVELCVGVDYVWQRMSSNWAARICIHHSDWTWSCSVTDYVVGMCPRPAGDHEPGFLGPATARSLVETPRIGSYCNKNIKILICIQSGRECNNLTLWNANDINKQRELFYSIEWASTPQHAVSYDMVRWLCHVHSFYQESVKGTIWASVK